MLLTLAEERVVVRPLYMLLEPTPVVPTFSWKAEKPVSGFHWKMALKPVRVEFGAGVVRAGGVSPTASL
jgi:hypothetical protein